MIGKFGNISPVIHESSYIAPSADIIGMVVLEENSSIWNNDSWFDKF